MKTIAELLNYYENRMSQCQFEVEKHETCIDIHEEQRKDALLYWGQEYKIARDTASYLQTIRGYVQRKKLH